MAQSTYTTCELSAAFRSLTPKQRELVRALYRAAGDNSCLIFGLYRDRSVASVNAILRHLVANKVAWKYADTVGLTDVGFALADRYLAL